MLLLSLDVDFGVPETDFRARFFVGGVGFDFFISSDFRAATGVRPALPDFCGVVLPAGGGPFCCAGDTFRLGLASPGDFFGGFPGAGLSAGLLAALTIRGAAGIWAFTVVLGAGAVTFVAEEGEELVVADWLAAGRRSEGGAFFTVFGGVPAEPQLVSGSLGTEAMVQWLDWNEKKMENIYSRTKASEPPFSKKTCNARETVTGR